MNGFPLSRSLSRRRFLQFVTLFTVCFALIVGCARPQSQAPAGSAANSDRVTMGTTLKARTVDPADAYEIFPGILLYNMGDRLYTYKPGTTELQPQLATELPQISSDGLTYTIPLRTEVTFHDGTPFTAEAMKFSLDRFMQNGGRPAFLLSEKVDSITAGNNEITIKLKTPFAAFPALLTFWGTTPVPQQGYEIGAGKFNPDRFVGTGPYKLASFSTDSIRLDVNENYWGEKPANQGIDIQLYTSAANLYNAFKTGSLDVAYQTLDPDQIASLQREAGQGGWQVIEAGTTVINYMPLNQKQAPMNDLNVRKAVAAMIDRNLINDRVFQGQAEPLYSMIPTSFDIYQPVFKDAFGDGDFAKAKEFLAAAGFSESKPFELEIWYPSSSTTRSIVANTLKESIERGLPGLVTVSINSAEAATLWENVEKGTYPAVLSNWYPDFYDADTFVEPFLSCAKGSTDGLCEAGQSQSQGSFYFSEKANQLIADQRAETDQAARDKIFAELQELLATDVPYIPLWQNKDFVFARQGVSNVAIEPTQQFLLWKISK
ncbi:peptide ABC transporter substrate-binding protein [Microcoleus sp. FACHB-1515]|uniref:ABC transporter substrate-binding protein n=1 Tax=Cyanophyceae TaxID=3028117 RepID=UPI00168757E9|nr:ABC transporter substrate-binding protein [Microcoleus sp. FACHB-1515]MBD2091306.1 peptide ABC transporter substrate-binding protein [Microcoleus sp. FACHB-1515]